METITITINGRQHQVTRTGRGTAYAFYCDQQPDFMQIMSNSPTTLKADTLEGLEFELS